MTSSFWVENTGDYPGGDTAVITVSGMESSVIRTMTVEGVEIDGTFSIGNGERVLLEVHLEVSEGVANGASGVIEVGASSQKNTAHRTTVDIVVEIRTIHDLRFTLEGEDSKSAEYPDKAYFTLFITNHGNVLEDVEGLVHLLRVRVRLDQLRVRHHVRRRARVLAAWGEVQKDVSRRVCVASEVTRVFF